MEKKKYDFVGSFNNGLAKVKLYRKYGYVNEKYEEIIPIKYDNIGFFRNGSVVAIIGLFDGVINKKGEEIISCDRFYFIAKQENNTFYCEGFDYSCIIDDNGNESDIIYKPQLDYDNLSLQDIWIASLSEPERYVYHVIQDSEPDNYGNLYKKDKYVYWDYKLRRYFKLTDQEIDRISGKIVKPYINSLLERKK